MGIHKSGFPRCLRQSGTATLSAHFSCSSSPSHQVCHRSGALRRSKTGTIAANAQGSGPRFALVGLWYLLTARPGAKLPKFVAIVGVFRTITCGGWTYVTSTDDHDWHDIFMISYLVATLPWTLGCLALSPPNETTIKYRKIFGGAFFGTIIPLVYFFIQHKVHKVPGGMLAVWFFDVEVLRNFDM